MIKEIKIYEKIIKMKELRDEYLAQYGPSGEKIHSEKNSISIDLANENKTSALLN